MGLRISCRLLVLSVMRTGNSTARKPSIHLASMVASWLWLPRMSTMDITGPKVRYLVMATALLERSMATRAMVIVTFGATVEAWLAVAMVSMLMRIQMRI